MNANEKKAGHLLALVTITVWGSTFIASKLMLAEFSPAQIMAIRFAVAYVVLWALRPRTVKFDWSSELRYLLLGCFGCSIYFMLENSALLYTYASNVSIIVATAPIITALLAHFFTADEKLNRSAVLGFVIAFSGVALVVFNGTVILHLSPVGDILSLLAAICWSVYSILLKSTVVRCDNVILTRKVMFYGFVTSLPVLAIEGRPINWSAFADPTLVVCALFLGVVGSGICYVAWNLVTKRLGIVVANSYIYVLPFVTMVTSAIFLKEKISLMGICGAVLIILGVIVCSRRGGKGQDAAPSRLSES